MPRRLFSRVVTLVKLRRCASVGRSTRALGRIWVHGNGKVYIASDVVLDGRAAPIELCAHPGAEIHIGAGTQVEGGASLEAAARIAIGREARIGGFSKILDNDFHSVGRERDRRPPSRPVVVEEGASVGARAILLPGAHVGRGATVPVAAVVSRRFGPVIEWPEEPTPALESPAGGPGAGDPADLLERSLIEKLRISINVLRAIWYLRGCERGTRVRATGPVRVANEGNVRIGDRTVFVGGMIPTEIHCKPGASIEVGSNTIFNYGVSLEAHRSVRIGRRAMFGSQVRVFDHGGTGCGQVVIGDDVWVAHGATIGPDVRIGSGSVIAAGSVVSSNVPCESLAIGNPARCMSLSLRANGGVSGAKRGEARELMA